MKTLSLAYLTASLLAGPVFAQALNPDAGGDLGIACDEPRFNDQGKLILDFDGVARARCEADRATALNYANLLFEANDRVRRALYMPPPVLFGFVDHLKTSDNLATWRADSAQLAKLSGHEKAPHARYWREGILAAGGGLLPEGGMPVDWRPHIRARACGEEGRGMVIIWLDPQVIRDRWTPRMVQRTVKSWLDEQGHGRGVAADRVPRIITGPPGRPALTRYDGDEIALDPDCFDILPRGALAMRTGLVWDEEREREKHLCGPDAQGREQVGYRDMERVTLNGVFVERVRGPTNVFSHYELMTGPGGALITREADALYDAGKGRWCRLPRDREVLRAEKCPPASWGEINGTRVEGSVIRSYMFREAQNNPADPFRITLHPVNRTPGHADPDTDPGVIVAQGAHRRWTEKRVFCTGDLPPGDAPEVPDPVANDPTITNWRVENCRTAHDGDFDEGTRTGWMQKIDYPDDWPVPDEIIVLSLDDQCFQPVRAQGTQTRRPSCPSGYTGAITEQRTLRWWNRDWADKRHDPADGDRTLAQAAANYDADLGQGGRPWFNVVELFADWHETSNSCQIQTASNERPEGREDNDKDGYNDAEDSDDGDPSVDGNGPGGFD